MQSEYGRSSRNHIEQVHQVPVADLNIIYNTVNNEFNKKCISFMYTCEPNNNIKCTISVTWPYEESFSDVGKSKKLAAHGASLMCLNWLHKQKKIIQLKPVLYNDWNKHNLQKSQKSVSISLTSELKNEIRHLIDTFDCEIKSIITVPSTTGINKDDLKEDSETDVSLNTISSDLIETDNFKSTGKVRRRQKNDTYLPIIDYREEILNNLENHQVLVINGDTGCGKSIQVPQFIIDEYAIRKRHTCKIIVSEPRRISAISLANRVALERGENVGQTVGYHVRFNSRIPLSRSSILYCTTGILLRKLEYQDILKQATHIILDEAHERNLQTDILLTLLKKKLKENPHLKLIVMSASMNAELFQRYFSSTVINIPGKLYPVKMHFMEDIEIFNGELLQYQRNNILEIPYYKIVKLIQWIITHKPPGGILCFLPGWQEIKELREILHSEINNLFIVPLHSKISVATQQKAFDSPPHNMTKVILSTDIAETGITITDINYVIDTAIKKDVEWNEDKFISSLNFCKISKANIIQRSGRAGRMRPGESYHLITKKEYLQLDSYSRAEIFKTPLEEAILISKVLTDEKTCDFFNSMIEPPSDSSLRFAVTSLQRIGVLDDNENLTSLGKRVSHFSMHPKLSRALIFSCIFRCLNPVLLISTQFSTPSNINTSLDIDTSSLKMFKEQKEMYHKTSDHIALVRYFQRLQENRTSFSDTFANSNNFKLLEDFKQLYILHAETLINSGMISSKSDFKHANMYVNNYELCRAVLFAATNQLLKRNAYGYKNGLFTNNANKVVDETNKEVILQSHSVNFKRKTWPSEMLTYINKMEFVKRHSRIVSDTSIISPLTVLLFSQDDAYCEEEEQDNPAEITAIYIKNMNHMNLCCEKQTAHLLLKFRSIIWRIVNFIVEYEGTDDKQSDLKLVKSYKDDMLLVLSRMLREASKDIDGVIDGDDEDTDDDKKNFYHN
ncbi:unnamed protein product [Xylocopa violacea]|uniref:ATP-dependent RNA helicase DHX30 n=1 Tax=Xylocopa violacea TaxID=135666 RepID=A0ABP1NFF8_XYLVO